MEDNRYICITQYGNVAVVENIKRQWGVISINGDIIVPFGKYGWIDGFDSGLARVRTHVVPEQAIGQTYTDVNGHVLIGDAQIQHFFDIDAKMHPNRYSKWGIINEHGKEVLPVLYDDIWRFRGKNRFSTKVVKDGVESDVYFHDLNPLLPVRGVGRRHRHFEDTMDYNPAYDKSDTWYAMTDGMYGDEPDSFDGDYGFMGY